MTGHAAQDGAGGEAVRYDIRGRTAVITMNRPRFRNAQNSVLTYALDAAFARAVGDDDVAVIVLAGEGDHFSARHDIGTPGRRAPSLPRPRSRWPGGSPRCRPSGWHWPSAR